MSDGYDELPEWSSLKDEKAPEEEKLVYKSHCTHCTSIIIHWFSTFPSVMTSKKEMSLMSPQKVEWHQWHENNKYIALENIDNQHIIVSVQWVQCVFGSRKKWRFRAELHRKRFIFRNDEFLEAKWWVGGIFYIILGCFFV